MLLYSPRLMGITVFQIKAQKYILQLTFAGVDKTAPCSKKNLLFFCFVFLHSRYSDSHYNCLYQFYTW
uniref:Uncharacterized protein n=1 Tax=Anguilla anguilla TaxID=7936 RepID=A0A0E9WLE0_ANGAN